MTDVNTELHVEVDRLTEELGRRYREIETLKARCGELEQEVDYQVEQCKELVSQRQACADSAERWEARARTAERELEDMRRRVLGA